MEKRIVYNKLVRDHIPQIIEASGKSCAARVLGQAEYLQALDAKLSEELAEYLQSKDLEELADLLEVMKAVVQARGSTWESLEQCRMEKQARRGGFAQRIFLEAVEE